MIPPRRSLLPGYRRFIRSLATSTPAVVASAAVRGFVSAASLVRAGHARVITLQPATAAGTRVLLAHVAAPSLARPTRAVGLPTERAARALADALLALGCRVDAVSSSNHSFVPRRPYDVVIGSAPALSRLVPFLGADCLKVLYLDTADILFQNAAETSRLVELKDRRGLVLAPQRFEQKVPKLHHADCALLHGNDYTRQTYAHATIPIFSVPTPAVVDAPSPTAKDVERCRRHFVWIGGRGLVHKGLDRVLEAFAGAPDLTVTVCGSIEQDKAFEAGYARELHHTPNIRTLGWIDLGSRRFRETAGQSVGVVFPSCAEGQAGEVVAGMAAGLIPLASRECGVDLDEIGIPLKDCSVQEVADAVRGLASLPALRLRELAVRAWERAQRDHGPASVTARYHEVMSHVLALRGATRPPVP